MAALNGSKWDGATNPSHLLTHAKQCTGVTRPFARRKFRLFAVGCVRRIELAFTNPAMLQFLEVAEEYANDDSNSNAIRIAQQRIRDLDLDEEVPHSYWRMMSLAVVRDPWEAACVWRLIAHHLDNLHGDMGAGKRQLAALVRCIFGNPFRPVKIDPEWLTSTVVQLARGIYDERDFDRLPILADALQDAGCDNPDVLNHCRQPGPHARGCWVVDLVLGKQ